MNATEITTIKEAAALLEDDNRLRGQQRTECAARLRDMLPKPRFYAEGRKVWMRQSPGKPAYNANNVPNYACPDDATAALIAQDIAAAYNKHLGEVSE